MKLAWDLTVEYMLSAKNWKLAVKVIKLENSLERLVKFDTFVMLGYLLRDLTASSISCRRNRSEIYAFLGKYLSCRFVRLLLVT